MNIGAGDNATGGYMTEGYGVTCITSGTEAEQDNQNQLSHLPYRYYREGSNDDCLEKNTSVSLGNRIKNYLEGYITDCP